MPEVEVFDKFLILNLFKGLPIVGAEDINALPPWEFNIHFILLGAGRKLCPNITKTFALHVCFASTHLSPGSVWLAR